MNLSDYNLDKLLARAKQEEARDAGAWGEGVKFGLTPSQMVDMIEEILTLRDELLRLRLCETVDRILAEE